ncbi:hypothetical protein [Nocardia nova]|uniref:hypothetical protein n=1 Tax=Nocardia nova TaxID=37330 RepID=UPI0033EC5CAC
MNLAEDHLRSDGLLRTERLTVRRWRDRVDLVTEPTAALNVPVATSPEVSGGAR